MPGPVTLAAGLVISVVSFFLNKKSFSFIGAYSLFLYIGIIILFYGFVMSMIWYMNRKSADEVKEEVKTDITQKDQAIKKEGYVFDKIQQKEFDEDRYQVVVKCRNCNMPHYIYSNFCSNCGSRLVK